MTSRRLVVLACLILSATHPGAATAADLSDQQTRLGLLLALSPSDMPLLRDRAGSGDGTAMALLGESYALAFGGLRQDDAAAAEWLAKAAASGQAWAAREASFFAYRASHSMEISAAEATLGRARTALLGPIGGTEDQALEQLARDGLAEAQTLLARQLSTGRGAPLDPENAARWWARAAAHGDPSANAELGRAFARGDGVPSDPDASLAHYRRAADLGDVEGQTALGALCAHGTAGLSRDPVEALMWLALAGSHGGIEARNGFAELAVIAGADATRTALLRAARWKPAATAP